MTADRSLVSTIEFVETCHKTPALISYRARCSKPNCHCADGPGHGPYWYLRWRDHSGHHRRRYVRQADLEAVRTIVIARRMERQRSRQEANAARRWLRANRRLLRELIEDLRRLA